MHQPREPLPTRVEDTAPLPEAFTRALDDGLGRAGIALDPLARAAVDGHVRLLLEWNRTINLTAVRDPAGVAVLHVIDSLTALDLLRGRDARALVDLGSGGGFPGLPLAAALQAERAVLVDSVGKKARFLGVVTNATGLAGSVRVVSSRVEALADDPLQREQWPAVTARAVAGLAELAELAFPLLQPGGMLVAWKRGEIAAELAALERAASGLGGATIEVQPAEAGDLLPGHRLVVVTKAGPTPAGFPRDPAVRRRRPW